MNAQEIAQAAMELSETKRLDLARRIIASVGADREVSSLIAQAVKDIEDVVTGKVQGLTEAEFRDALR